MDDMDRLEHAYDALSKAIDEMAPTGTADEELSPAVIYVFSAMTTIAAIMRNWVRSGLPGA